jgi:sterol 3beta-glucosyltransferase
MVAAAGAGPRPVHHTSITEANFTVIVETLLDPNTKRAAEAIAVKMRREQGVRRAVESFHRNLPQALKKQGKKKVTEGLRISPKAVTVLSKHKMLDLTKLKL